MLKSTLRLDEAHADNSPDQVGIAVIGLGYWGPNLLRVLGDHQNVKVP